MSGRSSSAFSPEGLTLGVCLVTLGVLWTLANLGRLELLTTLRTWWPLSLVLWGLLELADLALRRSARRTP
jgi:cell wall-active antibiotic response 4TMS protein YvqF